MSHELLEFITPYGAPELVDELIEIEDALSRHEFNGHDDELSVYMTIVQNMDPQTVLSDVCTILRTGVETVFKGMNVELSPDVPFSLLSAITVAILDFDVGDDNDLLLSILESDIAPDEKLCEVLEARTEYSAEDLMPAFTNVGVAVIERMRGIIEQYELDSAKARDTREILNRVNLYHTENPTTLVNDALTSGIPPGTGMESLYTHFEQNLVQKGVEDTIRDLMGLSLYSGVSLEAIQDEVEYFVDDLYPALEDRMQATKAIRKEIQSIRALFGIES